jgi:hypothetical protein
MIEYSRSLVRAEERKRKIGFTDEGYQSLFKEIPEFITEEAGSVVFF